MNISKDKKMDPCVEEIGMDKKVQSIFPNLKEIEFFLDKKGWNEQALRFDWVKIGKLKGENSDKSTTVIFSSEFLEEYRKFNNPQEAIEKIQVALKKESFHDQEGKFSRVYLTSEIFS